MAFSVWITVKFIKQTDLNIHDKNSILMKVPKLIPGQVKWMIFVACHYTSMLDHSSHLMQLKQTALHYACSRGHVDIARLLIESGASIDPEDNVRLFVVCPWSMSCEKRCCVYPTHNMVCRRLCCMSNKNNFSVHTEIVCNFPLDLNDDRCHSVYLAHRKAINYSHNIMIAASWYTFISTAAD